MKAIVAKKIGMTQIYSEDRQIQPVTVLEAPMIVVAQIKHTETDGYPAVQLAAGERTHTSKPILGHLKPSGTSTVATIAEFRASSETELESWTVGQAVGVDQFSVGDLVTVIATSKGKGFAGVMKRHNFAGGPASHGSHRFHRRPGSIGSQGPQRVFKGLRMAGHMGFDQVTLKQREIVAVDHDKRLIAIKGAIPGPKQTIVRISAVTHREPETKS